MGIIRIFFIFGLVTLFLSINLISESKCTVCNPFADKHNLIPDKPEKLAQRWHDYEYIGPI